MSGQEKIMPIISNSISQDFIDMYDGFDSTTVGIGMQNPNIYATPEYQKKKIQKLVIGGISKIVYSGYENDLTPMCLALGVEPRYNTIIGLNLRYVPPKIRQNVMKYVLSANAARIRANQPLMINLDSLRRLIPQINGAIRRYKIVGIRVVETYKLTDWPSLITENSPFENHWREGVSKN
jgi:hypothetical protein